MRRNLVSFVILLACCSSTQARLSRLIIENRTEGTFHKLTGHFTGELNPKDSHNVIITDLEFAPRNARGLVEYSATFAIINPVQTGWSSVVRGSESRQRSAGRIGRRSRQCGERMAGRSAPRAGLQTITVPTAHNSDGSPLTGPVIDSIRRLPLPARTRWN